MSLLTFVLCNLDCEKETVEILTNKNKARNLRFVIIGDIEFNANRLYGDITAREVCYSKKLKNTQYIANTQ